MRLRFVCLFVVVALSFRVFAQAPQDDRKELADILKERKEKFGVYAASLDKRSGIFGNKTKKDMERSNEILAEIVRTDNRIISVLNRILDYRTFEKSNMNYDLKEREERFEKLNQSLAIVTQQSDKLVATNKMLNRKISQMEWVIYGLVLLLGSCVYLLIKQRGISKS